MAPASAAAPTLPVVQMDGNAKAGQAELSDKKGI